MAWDRNKSNLRNLLAGFYWDVAEARRIVLEVGLNPAFMNFTNRSIVTWQSILEEADHHDKIGDIISKAIEEYPKVEGLKLAQRNLLLNIETPELKEDAWQSTLSSDQLEKVMGSVSTLRPIAFLERGLLVANSVARVVFDDGSSGSGFLTTNNLLVTNHHVISSPDDAKRARVEFNVQKTLTGLDAKVASYDLVPEDGFATSPIEERGGDDWAIVRVKGNPNETWGALSLQRATPKVEDEVLIIQHPGGGHKQIALSHNVVSFADEKRVQYLTDTLAGSSGSPVFNIDWQVVAIHHRGGWMREPNSKQAVFRNQGIHVNVLVAGLGSAGLL
jgi:V8-like Glu-specific endopeptidase